MLRPVLEPVLAQDILARYTRFASSVGAPAPLELLAPAAAPAPAETHVENLYQITRLVQENVLVNLQMDLHFLARHLTAALERADAAEAKRAQMLTRSVLVQRDRDGRMQAVQSVLPPRFGVADAQRILTSPALPAQLVLPAAQSGPGEPARPGTTPHPDRERARPVPLGHVDAPDEETDAPDPAPRPARLAWTPPRPAPRQHRVSAAEGETPAASKPVRPEKTELSAQTAVSPANTPTQPPRTSAAEFAAPAAPLTHRQTPGETAPGKDVVSIEKMDTFVQREVAVSPAQPPRTAAAEFTAPAVPLTHRQTPEKAGESSAPPRTVFNKKLETPAGERTPAAATVQSGPLPLTAVSLTHRETLGETAQSSALPQPVFDGKPEPSAQERASAPAAAQASAQPVNPVSLTHRETPGETAQSSAPPRPVFNEKLETSVRERTSAPAVERAQSSPLPLRPVSLTHRETPEKTVESSAPPRTVSGEKTEMPVREGASAPVVGSAQSSVPPLHPVPLTHRETLRETVQSSAPPQPVSAGKAEAQAGERAFPSVVSAAQSGALNVSAAPLTMTHRQTPASEIPAGRTPVPLARNASFAPGVIRPAQTLLHTVQTPLETAARPVPKQAVSARHEASAPRTQAAAPAFPAAGPALMELRRAPAAAAPARDEDASIPTVRRTRTVRTETEAPTAQARRERTEEVKRAVQEIPLREVERIADKVYRQIEARLRSEKMRRGM